MAQKKRKFALFAQNRLHALGSKTANGLILFRNDEVRVIIDASKAGQTAQDVLGYGGPIPIVAHMSEALEYRPDILAIGIAPIGGAVNPTWHPELRLALESGVNIWAGLHQFLGDIEEFQQFNNCRWT